MLRETNVTPDILEPRQRQKYLARWISQWRPLTSAERKGGRLTQKEASYSALKLMALLSLLVWYIGPIIPSSRASSGIALVGILLAALAPYGRLKIFQILPLSPQDILFGQLRVVAQRVTIALFLIIVFSVWKEGVPWFQDGDIFFYHSLSTVLVFYGSALFTALVVVVSRFHQDTLARRRHVFLVGQFSLTLLARIGLLDIPNLTPAMTLALDLGLLLSLTALMVLLLRDALRSLHRRPLKSNQKGFLIQIGHKAASRISIGWFLIFFALASILGTSRWIAGLLFLFAILWRSNEGESRHPFFQHGASLVVLGLASVLELVFFLGLVSLPFILLSQWLLGMLGLLTMYRWGSSSRTSGGTATPRDTTPSLGKPPRASVDSPALVTGSLRLVDQPTSIVRYLSQCLGSWLTKPIALSVSSLFALIGTVSLYIWLFRDPQAIHLDVLFFVAALLVTSRLQDLAFENGFLMMLPLSTRQVFESALRTAIKPLPIVVGCLLTLRFRHELVEAPLQTLLNALSWQNLGLPIMLLAMLVFLISLGHPFKSRHGLPDRWKAAALLQGWAVLDSRALASRLDGVSRFTEVLVHILAIGLLVAVCAVSVRAFSKDLQSQASLMVHRPEGTSAVNPGPLTFITLVAVLMIPRGWFTVLLWSSILIFAAVALVRLTSPRKNFPDLDYGTKSSFGVRAVPMILISTGCLAIIVLMVQEGISGTSRTMWTQLLLGYGWFIGQTVFELSQTQSRQGMSYAERLNPLLRVRAGSRT